MVKRNGSEISVAVKIKHRQSGALRRSAKIEGRQARRRRQAENIVCRKPARHS